MKPMKTNQHFISKVYCIFYSFLPFKLVNSFIYRVAKISNSQLSPIIIVQNYKWNKQAFTSSTTRSEKRLISVGFSNSFTNRIQFRNHGDNPINNS